MEKVVKYIRAVLMSKKGKSDLRELQKDYKLIVGEDIPFRELGFWNLVQFIKNVPSLKLSQVGHSIFIEAVPTESSKHMVDLISKQKSPRRLPSGRPSQQPAPANKERSAPYVGRPQPQVHEVGVSVNGNYISPGGHTTVQQRPQHSTTSSTSPPLLLPEPAALPKLTTTSTANSGLVRSISSRGTGSHQEMAAKEKNKKRRRRNRRLKLVKIVIIKYK